MLNNLKNPNKINHIMIIIIFLILVVFYKNFFYNLSSFVSLQSEEILFLFYILVLFIKINLFLCKYFLNELVRMI